MTRGWKSELGFQQIIRLRLMRNLVRARVEPSLAPFGCELGGLPTGAKNFAGTAIHLRLLHGRRLGRPKSKIQAGRLDFGFWSLGQVWILHKVIATTRRLGSANTTITWICELWLRD